MSKDYQKGQNDLAKAIYKHKDEEICKHCGLPIVIGANNPLCDHLYYPENCSVCMSASQDKLPKVKQKLINIKEFEKDCKRVMKQDQPAEEIAHISFEFVEMVFKMLESKKSKKTFWISKTSEKIHKLLSHQQEEYIQRVEGMKIKQRHSYKDKSQNEDRYLVTQGFNQAIDNVVSLLKGESR